MNLDLLLLVDLLVLVVFLVGIARFRDPRAARSGNIGVALAVLAAIAISVSQTPLHGLVVVAAALAVGSGAGWYVSQKTDMTQIPALVGLQNGAGGLAAAIVSVVELTHRTEATSSVVIGSAVLGVIVGSVTFSGSLVAAGKLAAVLKQAPTHLPRHGALLGAIAAAIVALAALLLASGNEYATGLSIILFLVAGAFGIGAAIRVGGADMPVMISWLNALSGVSAAFCGMVVQNRMVIACGATVAASGLILTHAMCQAMNRSLWTVLLGSTPQRPSGRPDTGTGPDGSPTSAEPTTTTAEAGAAEEEDTTQTRLSRAIDAARGAQKIIFIPGYGMALAHAQFEVVKLAERLSGMGKDVKFAIHPIAGRMPGHMHVLLAEADADSDLLFDLKEINHEFADTDMVLIVGACDVVNPAAIAVEGTPISGMPILAAHEARQIVVCNLDDRPGYSGVQNPLYSNPRTILLLGDAKATLNELLQTLA